MAREAAEDDATKGVATSDVAERELTERESIAIDVAEQETAAAACIERVRATLAARLPAYMIPARFIRVRELPLTANGKIDYRALAALEPIAAAVAAAAVSPASAASAAGSPRTDVEAALCRIWQDLLEVERVGVDDDFFELGGHSLLVMKLIVTIDATLHVKLGARALFTHSTVAAQAELIERERRVADAVAAVSGPDASQTNPAELLI